MNDIVLRIQNKLMKYLIQTGQYPNQIYLGQVEYKELKKVLEELTTRKVNDNIVQMFDNYPIYVVENKIHIGVGL